MEQICKCLLYCGTAETVLSNCTYRVQWGKTYNTWIIYNYDTYYVNGKTYTYIIMNIQINALNT